MYRCGWWWHSVENCYKLVFGGNRHIALFCSLLFTTVCSLTQNGGWLVFLTRYDLAFKPMKVRTSQYKR